MNHSRPPGSTSRHEIKQTLDVSQEKKAAWYAMLRRGHVLPPNTISFEFTETMWKDLRSRGTRFENVWHDEPSGTYLCVGLVRDPTCIVHDLMLAKAEDQGASQ